MDGKRLGAPVACAFLIAVGITCGCHTGRPTIGLGVNRFLTAAVTSIPWREDPATQEYVEALRVLDLEPQFQDTVLAARDAESARRDTDPRCVALYAQVALDCWPALTAVEEHNELDSAVWKVYHHSVAQFVQTAQQHERLDPASEAVFTNANGESVSVRVNHRHFLWSPDDFDELKVANKGKSDFLDRYWAEDGLGVPLVGIRQCESPEPFMNPYGLMSATAILRPPTPDDASVSGQPVAAVLDLQDALRVQQARYRDRDWKIARDLSAPLDVASNMLDRHKFASFLNPGGENEQAQLRMIEPYQPGRIPLVFVHGLLSDRFTWADLVNDLRSVPGLTENYQVWSFQYPTGQPFIRTAAEMRKNLHAIVDHLDPDGNDESLRQMVLVGHSMGGLVSKLQVARSGSAMWNSVATRSTDEIKASDEVRQQIDSLFFFEPSPYVKRVVFIGSPHRGSKIAQGAIGKLGSALVHMPNERTSLFKTFIEKNPDLFMGDLGHHLPSSIDLLRPDNPMLIASYRLPVNPKVNLHTIIGTAKDLSGVPADGVVPVESARHPGTSSELLIDATHTQLTGHEDTTKEIVRILNEHLVNPDGKPVGNSEPQEQVAGATTSIRG